MPVLALVQRAGRAHCPAPWSHGTPRRQGQQQANRQEKHRGAYGVFMLAPLMCLMQPMLENAPMLSLAKVLCKPFSCLPYIMLF